MAEAARQYSFHGRLNRRNYPEVSHDGHISIEDLRRALEDDANVRQIQNDFEKLVIVYELKILHYLTKNIPKYPTPIEFHITEISHVTNNDDLSKILESGGFKAHEKFSWWSLKIDEESIRAAEERYLEREFPNRSPEQRERQEAGFLKKFTTSPAFHINISRYGNFRFTFPLKDLMEAYKEQMCEGQDPVLRQYETVFYRKEIMYVVLVHSPTDNASFEKFPMIENSSFVDYKENQIVWKAQAVNDAIKFKLELNEEDSIAETEPVPDYYYVWDHVSLAFHFDDVLRFPQETLLKSITCCELDEINLANGKTCSSLEEAQEIILNI